MSDSQISDDLKTSFSLLELAQAEDPSAWHRIVNLYTPIIDYWIRQRGIQNESDLENTRQDVFTRVARSLINFSRDRGGSFRGWLRRITNNLITNERTRKKTPPVVDASATDLLLANCVIPQPSQISLFESLNDEGDDTEKIILAKQIMGWVQENHPKKQVAIFEQLVIEEKCPADVAAHFRIRVSRVYQIKSRILARIRRHFEDIV